MKHLVASLSAINAIAATVFAAPLAADEGGMLKTMPHGAYECALPGSAAGDALDRKKAEDFRLSSASRYRNAEGRGTYLLKGDIFTFTRGPKRGERYLRVGESRLRKLDTDGNETRLLCARRGG